MKERIFEKVNSGRRGFLKKLIAGASFAAPVIATFAVEALTPDPAYAAPNGCYFQGPLAPGFPPPPVAPAGPVAPVTPAGPVAPVNQYCNPSNPPV